MDGRLGECWHKDCCTINNENVKIFKPGKCVKVPPNGDERILKLIQSAEVLKVLKPIDNAILTRDKNKTNEMEIF